MKIKLSENVWYNGKNNTTGETIDMDKDTAKAVIKNGLGKEAKASPPRVTLPEEIDFTKAGLKKLTVPQLKLFCKDNGLDVPSRTKESGIIDIILAAQEAEAGNSGGE